MFYDMIRRVTTRFVQIRQATLDDLAQVEEFTKNTFSWGDYLPTAWARWVNSKRGELIVAEIDQKIVGTIHVQYLDNREAWLEGVRVHHDFRQRGVASQMIQAAHERARQKKCRVIRLETGKRNPAARRAFEKFGYQRIVEYGGYAANACDGSLDSVWRAKIRDASACWEMWEHAWMKRASKNIVPSAYGWRWWELTPARLAHEIRKQRVWMTPRAFMLLRQMDDALDIILLVGAKRDALKLLDAARVLAQETKSKKAFWLVPHVPRAGEWAEPAGYSFDEDGLLIYACAL